MTTKSITAFAPESTYYVNVIVRDEAGNKACYTMSSVSTGLRGDLNNDGVINLADLVTLATLYAQHVPSCDLNGDGVIDLYDLVIVAKLMQ